MRRALPIAGLLLASCACGGDRTAALPDWDGPPLRAKALADGSVEAVLTVPTASHGFEVDDVERDGEIAKVHLLHTTPGDAIVAQVVCELTVSVPPARLGDCKQVQLWIESRPRGGSAGRERLAAVVERQ